MKILTFGTCRVLQLFDKKINNTFLESIHYSNYGNFGGENVISFSHDFNQTKYLLELIYNNKKIEKNTEQYNQLKNLSVFISDKGDYGKNYLKHVPNFTISNSIENIHKQLDEVEYIIIEICTLKKYVCNDVPYYLDINDSSKFQKISDTEFLDDMESLIQYIKKINPKMNIIFISHIIKFRNTIFEDRKHILDLLNENVNKFNNCYVLSPCDIVNDSDLQDDRHYFVDKRIKMLNAISDLILEIEKSNHTN